MQNDARPTPQDPATRVVFSHPAESEPMTPAAAQHADLAAHFSAETEPRPAG